MKAPLARAFFTSARTLGTERAQRGRRCSVQVWLVKSITRRAVSLATMVAGLSAGGGGNLAADHSSITVCACALAPAGEATANASTVPATSPRSLVIPPRPAADRWRQANSSAGGGKGGQACAWRPEWTICGAGTEGSLSHDVPIGATQVSLAQLNERA